MQTRQILAIACASLLLTGCDDGTGPDDQAGIRVAFTTAPSSSTSRSGAAVYSVNPRSIEGSNGTLTFTDVRMIVAEFELKGVRACLDSDDGDELEECEFEAPPFLLSLPLDGGAVVAATDQVPLGTYTELEFEIEDLEEDEDDEQRTRQAIQSIRSQLRAAFPSFPTDASMVATGTFTARNGTPRPFTVFFDADIEVELDLVPPLVVTDGGANRILLVRLDPERWFRRGDQVLDLSAFDGQLLEFEDEFELGIRGVEERD